jgi:hypothetical protein
MPEGRSGRRQELWDQLNNLKQRDWIKAAETLGIAVHYSSSGTSHYLSLRDPSNPNPNDIRGLVSTVMPNLYKQANQKIFKKVLGFCVKKGISEDRVWESLGIQG